ncbi:hypothetical protein GOP47_0019426 [Adiantum capillus-veneris]|uniref:Uncharacterized protein n=1 Tax=Adiantum capillus-veneris TaxID=13818 RepID=A0A9D4UB17_ADICA|nr:hypothetical protein GOP47_0019426 [Adiantum capillus-veneris]
MCIASGAEERGGEKFVACKEILIRHRFISSFGIVWQFSFICPSICLPSLFLYARKAQARYNLNGERRRVHGTRGGRGATRGGHGKGAGVDSAYADKGTECSFASN